MIREASQDASLLRWKDPEGLHGHIGRSPTDHSAGPVLSYPLSKGRAFDGGALLLYNGGHVASPWRGNTEEQRKTEMQLSPPKRNTWLLATFLGVLGIVAYAIVDLPLLTPYAFWILVAAFVLFFLSTLLPGI